MKRLLCIILSVFISTATLFTAVDAENFDNLTFCDPTTSFTFSAHIFADKTEIMDATTQIISIGQENILSCSASGNVIYLFKPDTVNGQLFIFRYNRSENFTESFAVNCEPLYDKLCFASDCSNNVYFVSAYKNSCLCVFNVFDNSFSDFDFNSRIRQLINIDSNKVLIITDDSVYTFENSTYEKVSGSSLSYPVSYAGNLKVTDSQGQTFDVSDHQPQVETSSLNTEPETQSAEVTTTSAVTETKMIKQENPYEEIFQNTYAVPMGTTLSKIKRAFDAFGVTKVTKADGSIIDSGKVGTGTRVNLENGEAITLVIFGDVTGEGNINSRDTKAILDELSDKENLTEPFFTAADINSDGEITTKDALLISKMY